MDYDGGDDDDDWSSTKSRKSSKGSGSHSTLLNQDEGFTIVQAQNDAGPMIQAHIVVLTFMIAFLPLVL